MAPLVVDPSGYLKPHHSVGHCHGLQSSERVRGAWREGTSPSRSLGTVRDGLPSYGSHSPAWG